MRNNDFIIPSVKVPEHSHTGTHTTVLLVLLVGNHHPPYLYRVARELLPDYKHDHVMFLHKTTGGPLLLGSS